MQAFAVLVLCRQIGEARFRLLQRIYEAGHVKQWKGLSGQHS